MVILKEPKMNKFALKSLTALILTAHTLSVQSATEQRQAAVQNQPTTQSSANFYDRRSEGWYWYEDPEIKRKEALEKQRKLLEQQRKAEEAKVQKPAVESRKVDIVDPITQERNPTIVVQASEPKPKALSAEWLKQVMPETLMKAIDRPFEDDGSPSSETKAYMYMQRLSLDKAQNFSKAATTLTQIDPFLDETARVPVDTATNKVFSIALDKDKQEITNHLSKFTGLWFFYDSTCSFCVSQYQYLKDFRIKNNFKVMMISMDGKRLPNMDNNEIILPDRGQAKKLRLRITPSIVLVAPPNNFYVISQGLMTQDSLLTKILLVADQTNLLTKEQKEKLDPYSKGVLTPDQIARMQKVENELNNDPTKIVDVIKQAVGNE